MYKLFVLFLTLLLTACTAEQKDLISIQDAWIREAPPNASAMAGYLTIHNSSKHDRILTFAKSKQFNAVEIHRTIIKDGVARMRKQENLKIPAGGTLELKPGDYHLMLLTPHATLTSNDEVIVTLCLKNQGEIDELDVVMPIKKPKP